MGKKYFSVNKRLKLKKAKQQRRQGLLPANVFGGGIESIAVSCPSDDFKKLYNDVGEVALVYLKIEGQEKAIPTMIDEVQFHPITGDFLHASFRKVSLKDKITADIPVVIKGEVDIPDAVLVTVHNTLKVEALPTDLPEEFEVDVSNLTEIDQSITISDLVYDKSKVKLMFEEENENTPIVIVQKIKEEVVEEPEATEEVEGEVTEETEAGEKTEEKKEEVEKSADKPKKDN